jgi:hypothetical protein
MTKTLGDNLKQDTRASIARAVVRLVNSSLLVARIEYPGLDEDLVYAAIADELREQADAITCRPLDPRKAP